MRDTWNLMRDRRFLLLWLAMLVSATGTFMLLLAVSTHLLRGYDSGLGAASIFAFQWVLPVLLASLVRRFAESKKLRRVVICSEIGGAVVALAVGLFFESGMIIPVIFCFLIRGMFEAVTKTVRVVMVKVLFQGRSLEIASSTFNLSYYVGGVLGGLLGAALVGNVSLGTICIIDAITFLFSSACYLFLPDIQSPSRHSLAPRKGVIADTLRLMRSDRTLWSAAAYLVAATGIFQGFHNAARTLLPVRNLGESDATVMQLQMVSGVAIIGGALLVPLLGRKMRSSAVAIGVHLLGVILLWLTAQVRSREALFFAYFGFIFVFEVAYTAAYARLIQSCKPEDMATLSAGTNALGTGLLIVVTLLCGFLSDRASMGTIAVMMFTIGMLWVLLVELGSKVFVDRG